MSSAFVRQQLFVEAYVNIAATIYS